MNGAYKSSSPWGRLGGALIIFLDIVIAGYLLFAVTSFNNPQKIAKKCTKVDIEIADESTYGFLDAKEIKKILEKKGIYPLDKDLSEVSPRQIEEVLKVSSFVRTAQCCKTIDGHVLISITQRSPLVRIKSSTGEDYYIDENGGIMPNSKYTSDLIIVTGDVTKAFARKYVSVLARVIMQSDLWRNQIEQVNVQHDLGIEIVPRVGSQIIFLGYMPLSNNQQQRNAEVSEFVTNKLDRLEKFYKYGLSDAGWNKYSRIDVQFDNQIICKKYPQYVTSKDLDKQKPAQPVATAATEAANQTPATTEAATANTETATAAKQAQQVKSTAEQKKTDSKSTKTTTRKS